MVEYRGRISVLFSANGLLLKRGIQTARHRLGGAGATFGNPIPRVLARFRSLKVGPRSRFVGIIRKSMVHNLGPIHPTTGSLVDLAGEEYVT